MNLTRLVYVETVSFADYSGGGIARGCILLVAVSGECRPAHQVPLQ